MPSPTRILDGRGFRRAPARCHPDRPSLARGLCGACYTRALRHGDLIDHPRATYPADDVLDDYALLIGQGLPRWQIAARIGITVAALDKAIERGRARGDRRAMRGDRVAA